MPTTLITYSASSTYTISLAGLAANSARQGIAIDNSTTRYIDAMMYFAIQLQTGTPAGDRSLLFWFYGSEDGTNFGDNATGSDAPITLRSPNNFRGPFATFTPDAGGLVYRTYIPSVASFFGGNMPRRWGVVIENRTGIALNLTESNHIKTWTGISLSS